MFENSGNGSRRRYDLFIATAMSALGGAGYAEGREHVLALIKRLSATHGFRQIYFAGAAISDPTAFTGVDSLRQDLEALQNSEFVALLYPNKIVTSALVEIGYALALRLPCLLLIRNESDLPYLLRQAETHDGTDLLPPVKIATFQELESTAQEIAMFRDEVVRKELSHARE